jgi:sulfopyruvate decarboxylase alpha subunit
MPSAANSVADAAVIRNNRPKKPPRKPELPKHHPLKARPPDVSLLPLWHALALPASPHCAGHGNDADMLTIPPIASSFGASTTRFAIGLRTGIIGKRRENSMAPAEGQSSPVSQEKARAWHEVVLQTLKRNDIRLVPYVPDRVLTRLIGEIHADPFFTTFPTAREEEAVGIVSGAWMGGLRGAVLMQTSGFATLANVLASLAIPYQIPLIMFVSERGTLGEFNYGQSLVCRTMRPVLDSLAMEHHTVTRLDEFEFIVDRSIKQAITTQAPVALILSPLLTGGKVFDK